MGTNDGSVDDWFLSDFAMLHHTIEGLALKEEWLTAVGLVEFVNTTGQPIFHGDSTRPPGKIVFDQDSRGVYTRALGSAEGPFAGFFSGGFSQGCVRGSLSGG